MATMGGGAGGGGAGGGGAGGGGAGGGGAGGGGAGGGGAGGGGAGGGVGHAGGPSSAQLNTALTVTHDAVVGFWDGSADGKIDPHAGLPRPGRQIDYLDPARRMTLLLSELSGRFHVDGTPSHYDDPADPTTYQPGEAKLWLDEHTIFHTKAPTLDDQKRQLNWLRNYADLRFDRIAEINIQLGDILSFIGLAGQLDSGGRKFTLELLTVVQSLAYGLEMQVKNLCWAPRPMAFSTKVQPMIQTPDHSSFPSGHAIEAFALATMLHLVMEPGSDLLEAITGHGGEQAMVFRIAHRVAVNRTIAGVHFPIDSGAGAVMGCMIGLAVGSILNADNKVWKAKFDLRLIKDKRNFDFLLSRFPGKGWHSDTLSKRARGHVADSYQREIQAEWNRS